jgi:CubicO group peptidase (beta-lactamase class C family)
MAPAFGAWSTAADMHKFLSYLLTDAVQPAPSGPQRAKLYETQASGWGLGMEPDSVGGRRIARHSGWFAAHRSHLLLDTEAGVGVIVLTNGDNARPATIAEALYELALESQATSGSP